MAILIIPDEKERLEEYGQVREYLEKRGILHEQWPLRSAAPGADEEAAVLEAYAPVLDPFMAERGYAKADVISVDPQSKGLEELRNKFLAEHTHTEDEVRLFVEGRGLFWFNIDPSRPVFGLLCRAGDLISVPAETRHWFDLGPEPRVKAIRIFTDPAGWVAHYTGSGIDEKYNRLQGLWE